MAPKRDMKPGRQCRANLKQLYTVTSQVTRPTSNSLSHGCPKIKYLTKKQSYSSPKIELLWHSTHIQCMHWSRLQMLLIVYWDNIVLQLIQYNGIPYHFFHLTSISTKADILLCSAGWYSVYYSQREKILLKSCKKISPTASMAAILKL